MIFALTCKSSQEFFPVKESYPQFVGGKWDGTRGGRNREGKKKREKDWCLSQFFGKNHEIKLRIASRRITGSHMHRSGRLGKKRERFQVYNKLPPALGTRIGMFSGVDPNVSLQVFLPCELLRTFGNWNFIQFTPLHHWLACSSC